MLAKLMGGKALSVEDMTPPWGRKAQTPAEMRAVLQGVNRAHNR